MGKRAASDKAQVSGSGEAGVPSSSPSNVAMAGGMPLSVKIGYTMLAVSAGVFSISYAKNKIEEKGAGDAKQLYGGACAFIFMLIWGLLSNFVWTSPKPPGTRS